MKSKKNLHKALSLLLALTIFTAMLCPAIDAFAAGVCAISYSYTGSDADKAGFAQGTVTLTAPEGTYWLYWADNEKALDGYYEIAQMTVDSTGSASHNMFAQTAIPADAARLIAIKSEEEPADKTVAGADAVYDIPETKLPRYKTGDRRYRFASYSDVHIDGMYRSYKYADLHWSRALQTAYERGANFIVLSGDYTNNNKSYVQISDYEWKTYQKLLAESDYCNPVYEAIGNHELWQSVSNGSADFIAATGLEGSNGAADKAYYEKTINGDHFIFMALEGGFYPDRVEEFSTEQLDWLESLLKKYSGDGKNIYIIEHSLFYKYGAGDTTDGEPYYSIPLSDNQASTVRFKSLLEAYKDCIFISGHTHIAFAEQYNYSDNNGSSAQMIHNSSVGGTRHIINNKLEYTYYEDQSEGYIVDVFDDAIIFNGANVYYNMYDPNCCYIIKTSEQIYNENHPNPATLDSATADEPAADSGSFVEPLAEFALGDVNQDGRLTVKDATLIQRYAAGFSDSTLNADQLFSADVNLDGDAGIDDVTEIQKLLAEITTDFTASDTEMMLTSVKKNLSLYYRYSSYDCYQALKKEFRNDLAVFYTGNSPSVDTVKLSRLQSRLLATVDKENVDSANSSITVYYENTKNWSKVYAYVWASDGSGNMGNWPGKAATYVGKNSYGRSVYKYTISNPKYDSIIFTNGSQKTENLRLYKDSVCFYSSSNASPYSTVSYVFKQKYIVA